MLAAMLKRLLWTTLIPLLLISFVVVLLFPFPAVADMHVHSDRAAFEQLLNDVLQDTGATVAIHPQTGRLAMHGQPTTEFGLQLQEKIASRTRTGHAITDPHGRPVSIIIDAVRNHPHVAIGCFHGDGVQVIDLDDMQSFPLRGTGLPTRAAQLAHEFGEVFDSVRYGRITPVNHDRKPHGRRDFDLNHHGGAYTDENAVNTQEAGITRVGEGVSRQGEKRPDGATTVIIREPFTRGDERIFVETTLVKRADGTVQVAGVALEAATLAGAHTSVRSGRFTTAEAPGPHPPHAAFRSTGLLPRQQPGYLDLAWWWKLLCRWHHTSSIRTPLAS
ncbi:MAG TPA: hypothetical protein VI542_03775 [Candidatus Tectomicrobia bacterium]